MSRPKPRPKPKPKTESAPLSTERARAYLQDEIVGKSRLPGSRLPTLRELAKSAGVSNLAMQRALAELEARKIVVSLPKRGFYYLSLPEKSPPAISLKKWELIATRLERDILAGLFRPGTSLPQLRELQAAYGATYATLRKVLDKLVQTGVLYPFKRNHRVAPARQMAGHSALICIGLGDETGRLLIQNPRFQEFVFALQNAAALNQIRLLLIGHPPRQGLAALFKRIQTLRSQYACIGFVLWNTHLPVDIFLKTVAHVKPFQKPIAVMDEMNNLPMTPALWQDGQIRSFTLAGITAGRQIARYLLGLGHKHVGFLSCYHAEGWSQARWSGVEEIFRTAGYGGQAKLFALNEGDSALDPLASSPALSGMHRHFKQYLEDASELTKLYPSAHQLIYLQQSHEKLMRDMFMAMHLQPLLEAMLREKGMTACIAANDDMALVAMEYLQKQGRRIPEDLSIIGLDDSIKAAHFGVTSYNFNFPALAQRMMAFIRNPKLREYNGRMVLESEGSIMDRGSTRSC